MLASLTLCACSEPSRSSESQEANAGRRYCEFSFEGLDECRYNLAGNTIEIDLAMGQPSDDERALSALVVKVGDAAQELPLSRNATIIEGDKGYIQFRDINFDGIEDLAVTTSFGAANLYLDYWVYEAEEERFRYLGNFPDLTPHPEDNRLTSETKRSAKSYSRKTWIWQDGELVPEDGKVR